MLRFRGVNRFSSWPMVDLIDFNHEISKQRIPQQVDLKKQFGSNLERYLQTSYSLEYISHINPAKELRVLSDHHPHFKPSDRIFCTTEQLKRVRELETPRFHRAILKQFEDQDIFPLDSMENYKPKLICDTLTPNQLVLFNIPLNSDEKSISDFVLKYTKQQVTVEIERCSLNLNSHAKITFNSEAENYKNKLHLNRINGILVECKSVQDSGEQNVWDRSLVISNLNRSLNFQEILHQLGEFGRVINAVIPLEITNRDYPFEEEVRSREPVKLEIMDVESGETEIRFHPSESQFLKQYKDFPEYYDPELEQTVMDFQSQMDEKDDQIRLYRILTQKTIKCLRVPDHLKQQYKSLWMPPVNVVQAPKDFQSELYNKTYENRGYCICTFASKGMAQRALHSINQKSSKDLAQLSLPMINNPAFKLDDESHSKNERYGARFRIENLYLPQLRAMKAWEGIELYQVDLNYNLQKLESIRKKVSSARDEVAEIIAQQSDTDGREKLLREQLRQKVYADLGKNDDFKKFVEEHSFTKTSNFDQNFKVIESKGVGRTSELEIESEEYNKYVQAFAKQAQKISSAQIEFADKVAEKYQLVPLKEKKLIPVKEEDDELLMFLKRRIVKSYDHYDERKETLDLVEDTLGKALEFDADLDDQIREQKAVFMSIQNKTELKESLKKLRRRFSTLIRNQNYIRKQQIQKHEEFIEELKKLLLGQYKLSDDIPLIAVHPLTNSDYLQLAKQTAKDIKGSHYLDDDAISYVRQFDIPLGTYNQISQWEENRRDLISQLSREQLNDLKRFTKQGYTQNTIQYFEHGFPVETFEMQEDQDPQKMVDDLNGMVAHANELYEYHEDPQTKKKYIVKREKPYFKADISILKNINEQTVEQELFEALQTLGFSQEECQKYAQTIQKGEMPEELITLFDSTDDNLDYETAYKQYGIPRKEMEVLDGLNLRDMSEASDQIEQQLYMRSIILQHDVMNQKNIIKDGEVQELNLKDKHGRHIQSKYKKY